MTLRSDKVFMKYGWKINTPVIDCECEIVKVTKDQYDTLINELINRYRRLFDEGAANFD